MNPLLKEIRHNPLLWLLAFVPVVRQPSRMDERNERSAHRPGTRTEYRFGLVLLLLLATFMVLMTGSTSTWVRPLTVALSGATLLAALFAADASLRVRRIAGLAVAIAIVASLSLVGVDRSGEAVEGRALVEGRGAQHVA